MGRFRDEFAGRKITFRLPYEISGEQVLANGSNGVQFPEATFLHNVDKPFEIHQVKFQITPFDNSGVPAIVSPEFTASALYTDLQRALQHYVRVRISDVSKNENLTKNATLISSLVTANGQTWDWEDPYTLVRSEGLQIALDSIAPGTFTLRAAAATAYGGAPIAYDTVTVANLRVEIALKGFLLVVAPASETR